MNPTQITTDTLIRKIGLLVVENDLLRGQVQAATQQIAALQKKATPTTVETPAAGVTQTASAPKRRGRPAQQVTQNEGEPQCQ
jgi:hypothetical protein